jgi:SAM-dependent methyltransferase
MNEDEIRRRLADYSFYHTIRLSENIETPGQPNPSLPKTLRALRSVDLANRRVLDIGCRDGLLSFEAEALGAREVIAIDNDLSRAAVELLIPCLGSRVRMHEMNLLDLTPETFGLFDVVILAGVLYHLRYPFHGLRIVRDVLTASGVLILETAIIVDDNRYAMLHCPTGADSPYEPTSVSFFNMKGLTDTLVSFGLEVAASELQNGTRPSRFRRQLIIDRVVLVCRRTARLASPEAAYWDATHRLHSDPGSAREG